MCQDPEASGSRLERKQEPAVFQGPEEYKVLRACVHMPETKATHLRHRFEKSIYVNVTASQAIEVSEQFVLDVAQKVHETGVVAKMILWGHSSKKPGHVLQVISIARSLWSPTQLENSGSPQILKMGD